MAMWMTHRAKAGGARIHLLWAITAGFLFVAGWILGLQSSRQSPADSTDNSPTELARCLRVLDGDTFEVEWQGQNERVRLLGIDAPETRRTKTLRAQAELLDIDPDFLLRYGEITKQTAENWLLNRDVRLIFPNDEVLRDNFGRLLCYVELQGTDIGERLLLGGNAIIYEAAHPREESYRLFQAEAQKQRRGIWRNY
jgi:micrococcal nuclease